MRTENSMNETRQEPATPAPDQHYGLRNHLRCELRRELEAETSLLAKARRVVRERPSRLRRGRRRSFYLGRKWLRSWVSA